MSKTKFLKYFSFWKKTHKNKKRQKKTRKTDHSKTKPFSHLKKIECILIKGRTSSKIMFQAQT